MSQIATFSLLEVASLQSHTSAADVRALITGLQVPVSIVGELHTHPAILVEVDSALVEHLNHMFQPYSHLEIIELRRYFHRAHRENHSSTCSPRTVKHIVWQPERLPSNGQYNAESSNCSCWRPALKNPTRE